MATETIKIPDLGGADDVEVIEVAVAPGDKVEPEQTLIVLESDKASMDVPSTQAGTVVKVLLKEGDTVNEGAAILELDTGESAADPDPVAAEASSPQPAPEPAPEEQPAPAEEPAEAAVAQEPQPASAAGGSQTADVPDIGTDDEVDVIEISVAPGDEVSEGDTLIVLEGDKATMEVPSPFAGKIEKMLVSEGAKVKTGSPIAEIQVAGGAAPATPAAAPAPEKAPAAAAPTPAAAPAPAPAAAPPTPASAPDKGKLAEAEAPATDVYAGPAVRLMARELGVDLRNVEGSGPRGRVQKDDVTGYVKKTLAGLAAAGAAPGAAAGAGIPAVPDMDFSKFGEVEEIALSKIARLTAANMQRNWLNVPHVTQFDDADITDLEAFRKGLKAEAEKRGTKLTPMPFIMLACARALAANPVFNRSWHSSGEKVIQKNYIHIGMAVDSPRGLVVPVVRDADKKGLWELATEINELAAKARDGKLTAAEMQGGCFSISSLGAIGGTGFTPIVNAPEAAILGVSKAAIKPVWNGKEFEPRQMLPLALSYDHRLINGGDAGRFMTYLVSVMGDLRRMLL